jgi:hypothetical protein
MPPVEPSDFPQPLQKATFSDTAEPQFGQNAIFHLKKILDTYRSYTVGRA